MARILIKSVQLERKVQTAVRTTPTKKTYEYARGVTGEVNQKAEARMQRHYEKAIRTTLSILRNPRRYGLGGISGGEKTARVNTAYRQKVDANLGTYKHLSETYAARSPKSKQFWKKSAAKPLGGRSQSLREAVAQAYKSAPARVRFYREARLHFSKGVYTSRAGFYFSALPPPLDKIVRFSFVKGKPFHPSKPNKALDRSSEAVVAYPERQRPLLGPVSAALGRAMRDDLHKRLEAVIKPIK